MWLCFVLWFGFFFAADPLHHPLHQPGQDPLAPAADTVPLGGLLLLRREDRAYYTGGTVHSLPPPKLALVIDEHPSERLRRALVKF